MIANRSRVSRERRIGYAAGITASGLVLLLVVGVTELVGADFSWTGGVTLSAVLVVLGAISHTRTSGQP